MKLILHGGGNFQEALDDLHTALTFDPSESVVGNILNMIDECNSTCTQPSSLDNKVVGGAVDSHSSDNDNEVVWDAVDSQSSDNVDSVVISHGMSSIRMPNIRSLLLSSNQTNRVTTLSMSSCRGYCSVSKE